MIRSVSLVLLGLASTAIAAPCDVRIVRAPDDVRERIHKWVDAEPSCTRAVEVRAIQTPDGLYLFARDDRGRVHERLVPDADSAGVLVASWAADDSMAPPSAFDVAPAGEAPSAEDAEIERTKRIEAAEATRAGVEPPDFDEERPAERARRLRAARVYDGGSAESESRSPAKATDLPRWITVAALMGDGGRTSGMHAEVDLLAGTNWSLAVSGQVSSTETGGVTAGVWNDRQVVAVVGRTWHGERWSVRLAGGVGITNASGDVRLWDGYLHHLEGTAAMLESSLLVSRRVGERWAITAGALGQSYQQDFAGVQETPYATAMTTQRADAVLSFVGGVKYAL